MASVYVKAAIVALLTAVIGLVMSIASMYMTDPNFRIQDFPAWGGVALTLFLTGGVVYLVTPHVFNKVL